MADELEGWLERERERLGLALARLETSDITAFFTAIGELRATFAMRGEAFLELNKLLDSLVAARIASHLNRVLAESRLDPLTGLGHRGAFDHRLRAEIERSDRYHRQFALILFDLDNFKHINDRYGHLTGDQALVRFPDALRTELRQSDEPFRIGGDEFAAILPETELDGGETIGHRVERLLEHATPMEPNFVIHVSWGIANWPLDGGGSDDGAQRTAAGERLLLAADRRLYAAKVRKRY